MVITKGESELAHSIIAQHRARKQLQQDKQKHQFHFMTSWATTVCKEASQEKSLQQAHGPASAASQIHHS